MFPSHAKRASLTALWRYQTACPLSVKSGPVPSDVDEGAVHALRRRRAYREGKGWNMLSAHFEAVEHKLLVSGRIPANSGNSLHKGMPREAFIREFLEGHLSERVAVGTGEIIDADCRPGGQRHQTDIVIYKRDYPRLDFGGGVIGFLVESVVATIEVKSTLDEEGLRKATTAARDIKALKPSVTGRHGQFTTPAPPSIMTYVVAYDGPAKMRTVRGWFPEIAAATGIEYPALPKEHSLRTGTASPALDAIFVLGRGFIHFGNTPIGFFLPQWSQEYPDHKWAISDCPRGSLLLLFVLLTMAVSGTSLYSLNPLPYLKSFQVSDLSSA